MTDRKAPMGIRRRPPHARCRAVRHETRGAATGPSGPALACLLGCSAGTPRLHATTHRRALRNIRGICPSGIAPQGFFWSFGGRCASAEPSVNRKLCGVGGPSVLPGRKRRFHTFKPRQTAVALPCPGYEGNRPTRATLKAERTIASQTGERRRFSLSLLASGPLRPPGRFRRLEWRRTFSCARHGRYHTQDRVREARLVGIEALGRASDFGAMRRAARAWLASQCWAS